MLFAPARSGLGRLSTKRKTRRLISLSGKPHYSTLRSSRSTPADELCHIARRMHSRDSGSKARERTLYFAKKCPEGCQRLRNARRRGPGGDHTPRGGCPAPPGRGHRPRPARTRCVSTLVLLSAMSAIPPGSRPSPSCPGGRIAREIRRRACGPAESARPAPAGNHSEQ
jgi:hypothetical protein